MSEKLRETHEEAEVFGCGITSATVSRRVTLDGEFLVVKVIFERRNSSKAWRKDQRRRTGKPGVRFAIYRRAEYLRSAMTLRHATRIIELERARRAS